MIMKSNYKENIYETTLTNFKRVKCIVYKDNDTDLYKRFLTEHRDIFAARWVQNDVTINVQETKQYKFTHSHNTK